MNSNRAYYYPLPIYLFLLLLVWLGTFFVDVVGLLTNGTLHSSSLISAEGVRWALRTALSSINALPWGATMVLVAVYGLVRASGLSKVVWRLLTLRRLTVSELRAILFSLVAALFYAALLYMSAVSPWNVLSAITKEPSLSPLLQGWALLLLIGTLAVSLVYGFVYGSYSSMMDVITSTGNTFVLFVPAMMSLLPAAGIIPCLQYAGVQSFFGVPWSTVSVVLYLSPFIYVLLLDLKNR